MPHLPFICLTDEWQTQIVKLELLISTNPHQTLATNETYQFDTCSKVVRNFPKTAFIIRWANGKANGFSEDSCLNYVVFLSTPILKSEAQQCHCSNAVQLQELCTNMQQPEKYDKLICPKWGGTHIHCFFSFGHLLVLFNGFTILHDCLQPYIER